MRIRLDHRQRTNEGRRQKTQNKEKETQPTKTNSIFQEQIQARLDECRERCATARQSGGAMQLAVYDVGEDDVKEENSQRKYPSRCKEWSMMV